MKIESNVGIKVCLARLQDEKKLAMSASGGVFGELARNIIKNNGVVYGAAFNEDFSVSHKRIDNLKKLSSVFKSKYVQSSLDNVLAEVKKDLENGTNVLFSGTPCQVFALKEYLGRDYKTLLTVDLICHGAPINIIWKKYLDLLEKKYKSKISKIDFRFYNEKEPAKIFLIEFENGERINEVLFENPYGKAFLTNMILNQTCYVCDFKNFRNQSDITLADAHGYINDEFNKVSLILFNTEKGQYEYKKIADAFMVFDDYDAESLILNNYPIVHPPIKHDSANAIIEKYKENSNIIDLLEESTNPFNHCKHNSKNVGILNFHYENYNYGANLVAYSLSKVVERLGYNPYIINFDPFPEFDAINRYRTFALLKFRQKHLKLTPKISDSQDLKVLNSYFDNFIVGSDQVWRKVITDRNYASYFFDFVEWDKTALSYAASFGHEKFEGDELETKKCETLLKKFTAVSVREKTGQRICKETFNVNSSLVLDPTLLLNVDDYEEIINEKNYNKGHIAYYCLFDQEVEFLNDLKRLLPNKKHVNIKGYHETINLIDREIFTYESVGNWVQGIKNSDFVVTDSYHGLLFAILYNKDYICLGANSASKSRFDNIFELLQGNSESRLFTSLRDIDDIKTLKQLDYKIINNNLSTYRKSSLEFLQNNIGKPKTYETQEIPEILNYFNEMNNDIASQLSKMSQENESLQKTNKELTQENENIQNLRTLLIQDSEKLSYMLAEAEQNLRDVTNSKSWKMTAPLRKATNLVKKYTKKK